MKTRDYKKEYGEYHVRPKQKKDRAGRNKARRAALKSGKVKKGSAFDVHHKDKNPRNNARSNLRIRTKSKNRSDNY